MVIDPKATFLISDTHFFHTNVINYCDRPFKSAEDMNEQLIQNWNSVVTNQDTVIHLGDVGMAWRTFRDSGIVDQLNGAKKILILGNHDRSRTAMIKLGFHECHKGLDLEVNNYKFLLRHKPQDPDKLLEYDYQLHGHTHSSVQKSGQLINLSVEAWDYTPVPFTKILDLLNQSQPVE